MKKTFLFLLAITTIFSCSEVKKKKQHTDKSTHKVVWITLDGLRWQELFGGADSLIMNDKRFVKNIENLKEKFHRPTREERRKTLFPFIWNTVAKEGVIYGNRWKGSKVNLTNSMHFSYPGYSEILCGFADDVNVTSNDKIYNKNTTVLEKINNDPKFKNSVLAFGSWDVFPYIINDQRSKIPVNAGYCSSLSKNPSVHELFLDKTQQEVPMRWEEVRFDIFTQNYALEAMKHQKPQLIYIAYGETDDFAHDGKYDAYLTSAQRADHFIKELWDYTQSDDFYKGQTTFIITTDHGRGTGVDEKNTWKHHSKDIKGCDQTWLIAFGNKIPKKGECTVSSQLYSNQLAKTVADILGVKIDDAKMGKAIEF
ncbi:MAG: phosphoglyceromutase [Flavobacteriaceae bacterium]|nr:phosphoglyceromutase [Flavobacteriaceae bacterium]